MVKNNFPIPTDGILGKDFIRRHSCKLDYFSMTLTIRGSSRDLIVPICEGSLGLNEVLIPPRCEIVDEFDLIGNFTEDQFIDGQEISDGVYIGRSVVSPKGAKIRVLNTTHFPVLVSKRLRLDSQRISDFCIYNIRNDEKERKKAVKERIAKGSPKQSSNSLLELCEEFADVFVLPDDRLSVNNFYEEKLRLTDDQPVYTKNYRFPHSQKQEIAKQVSGLLKNNMIEQSCSSFNSPIILVPKRSTDGEKKWRMCIDCNRCTFRLTKNLYRTSTHSPGSMRFLAIWEEPSSFQSSISSQDFTKFLLAKNLETLPLSVQIRAVFGIKFFHLV